MTVKNSTKIPGIIYVQNKRVYLQPSRNTSRPNEVSVRSYFFINCMRKISHKAIENPTFFFKELRIYEQLEIAGSLPIMLAKLSLFHLESIFFFQKALNRSTFLGTGEISLVVLSINSPVIKN